MPGNGGFRLHLQPIRHNAVQWLQHTVKAGQDPQMLLHIIILTILEDRRSHVCILDPVISQKRRRKIFPKIHVCEPLGIFLCDLVIAGPEFLLFFIGQTLNPLHQDFCFLHKRRKFTACKEICIHPHLFGRRNDNSHLSSCS